MCADRLDPAASPYASILAQRGFTVLTADLFTQSVIQTPRPEGTPLKDRLAIVPSPRAANALARQSWFAEVQSSLRAVTPGVETTRRLQELGVQPVWSAKGGFLREDLPASLRARPKLYLGNAALKPAERSAALRPDQGDVFLPIYRRELSHRCPWSLQTARLITQAPALTVVALSPTQRAGFEAVMTKLGSRRPKDLRLICLTNRIRAPFSANFWTEIACPPHANRASMIQFLNFLAF